MVQVSQLIFAGFQKKITVQRHQTVHSLSNYARERKAEASKASRVFRLVLASSSLAFFFPRVQPSNKKKNEKIEEQERSKMAETLT